MNMMVMNRPATGEPVLPHPSPRVVNRLEAFLIAFDPLIETHAGIRNRLLAGSAVMPFANMALAGTSCGRPLLFNEGEKIARETGFDVVLLRYDAERGVTFDIRLQERPDWLCRHVAWRRGEGDLRLIPEAGTGPFLRVTGGGIECEQAIPFLNADERQAGIIRAVTDASFAGRI
jgi:hypothetical protein